MGILKILAKPFKAIWKGVKWVGKKIMKGFSKLGKFMNKFGILGQVGMMFITGGISSAMFAGLRTLGQGFMAGLANSSSAVAQAAHKVLQGAAKLAKIPGNTVGTAVKETFGSITEAVGTTVKDTWNYIGKAMPGGAKITAPDIAGSIDKIASQTMKKVSGIIPKTKAAFTESMTDASKFFGDALGPQAIQPDYRGIPKINPKTGKIILDSKGLPEIGSVKEIAYSSQNKALYDSAREAAAGPASFDIASSTAADMDAFDLDPEAFGVDFAKERAVKQQAFDKLMKTAVPTESLLRRSGSAMADEAKDYFTLSKFGSAGMQGVSQSLIPRVGPEGVERFLPSGIQASAQTDQITQQIAAMTGAQIRDKRHYQIDWDIGTASSLDNFYDDVLSGSETYNRFINPSLKQNLGTSYS